VTVAIQKCLSIGFIDVNSFRIIVVKCGTSDGCGFAEGCCGDGTGGASSPDFSWGVVEQAAIARLITTAK